MWSTRKRKRNASPARGVDPKKLQARTKQNEQDGEPSNVNKRKKKTTKQNVNLETVTDQDANAATDSQGSIEASKGLSRGSNQQK